MPKILRDTQKDCGKPGCRKDYPIPVLARGDEMVEQRRLPPLALSRHGQSAGYPLCAARIGRPHPFRYVTAIAAVDLGDLLRLSLPFSEGVAFRPTVVAYLGLTQ
jgi:hypothetical protein